MFRAIIVDDEPWSILGLKKLFRWAEYGFDIIAESTDSLEALEIIKSQSPDVVFTDIRMPEMNGLELMRAARDAKSSAEFVIISGFGEFEYAQEAIHFGVFDYLVKPISQETADLLIKRLHDNLTNKRADKEGAFFEALCDYDRDTLTVLSNFGYMLPYMNVRVAALLNTNTPQYSFLPMDKDKLRILCFNSGTRHNKNISIYLINSEDLPDYNKIPECLLEPGSSETSTVGVSQWSNDLRQIPYLISNAETALNSQIFIYKKPDLLMFSDTLLPDNQFRQYVNSILNISSVPKLPERLTDEFIEKGWGIDHAVYLWNQAAAILAAKYAGFFDFNTPYFCDEIELLNNYNSLSEMCAGITELFAHANTDSKQVNNIRLQNAGFNKLLEYVNRNFTEELSLKQLSSHFFINLSHCCILFKKATGKNFSEYVTDLRMARARELLADSTLSIAEVSRLSGYPDHYYFSKVFKKFQGSTPTTYRNNIIRSASK